MAATKMQTMLVTVPYSSDHQVRQELFLNSYFRPPSSWPRAFIGHLQIMGQVLVEKVVVLQ